MRDFHPIRANAARNYQAALIVLRVAEDGSDLNAYLIAKERASTARRNLVRAEIEYPTRREEKHAARIRVQRNMGLAP